MTQRLRAILDIKRILLPVDIPIASLGVIHQAAILARHFKSEIVMLQDVTVQNAAASLAENGREPADRDLLAVIKREAQKQEPSLGPELDGVTIRSMLVNGDAAVAIVQTAEEEMADLIMMPSHGFTFYQFLMGSVTAKAIHEAECPIWTGAHVQEPSGRKFAIRTVLCAVKFGPRADITVSWAAQMAAEFGARLILANITSGVEMWGLAAATSIKGGKRSSSATLPSKWQGSSKTQASRRMYSSAVVTCPRC